MTGLRRRVPSPPCPPLPSQWERGKASRTESLLEQSNEISDQQSGVLPATSLAAARLGRMQAREAPSIREQAWQRFRRHKAGMVALVVVLVEIVVAVAAPVLIPRDL